MSKIKFPSPHKQPIPTRDDFLKDVVKQLVKRRNELGMTQEQIITSWAMPSSNALNGNADREHRLPLTFIVGLKF